MLRPDRLPPAPTKLACFFCDGETYNADGICGKCKQDGRSYATEADPEPQAGTTGTARWLIAGSLRGDLGDEMRVYALVALPVMCFGLVVLAVMIVSAVVRAA